MAIMLEVLGPPSSRSPRDEHRRSNGFDKGYQQQQQQRYDLDLVAITQNVLERNHSAPDSAPPSSESSLGGIGENPSLSPSSTTTRRFKLGCSKVGI